MFDRQIEDWQSEKSDVSLLEGAPVNMILAQLDDACNWLRASNLSSEQQEALLDRILLRKVALHPPNELFFTLTAISTCWNYSIWVSRKTWISSFHL
jgi:hypothetical protein